MRCWTASDPTGSKYYHGAVLAPYGVSRPEPKGKGGRGAGPDVYKRFATNCLLARRLVERGVRFVTMVHASWAVSYTHLTLPTNREV